MVLPTRILAPLITPLQTSSSSSSTGCASVSPVSESSSSSGRKETVKVLPVPSDGAGGNLATSNLGLMETSPLCAHRPWSLNFQDVTRLVQWIPGGHTKEKGRARGSTSTSNSVLTSALTSTSTSNTSMESSSPSSSVTSSVMHSLRLDADAHTRQCYQSDEKADGNPGTAGRQGLLCSGTGPSSPLAERRYDADVGEGVISSDTADPSSIMTRERSSPLALLSAEDNESTDAPPVTGSTSPTMIHFDQSLRSSICSETLSDQIIATSSSTTTQLPTQSRSQLRPGSLSAQHERSLHCRSACPDDNSFRDHERTSVPTATRTVGDLHQHHHNGHTPTPLPSNSHNPLYNKPQVQQHETPTTSPPPYRQRPKNVFLFRSVSDYLAPPSIASRKYVDKHFDIASPSMESYHTTMTMMLRADTDTGTSKLSKLSRSPTSMRHRASTIDITYSPSNSTHTRTLSDNLISTPPSKTTTATSSTRTRAPKSSLASTVYLKFSKSPASTHYSTPHVTNPQPDFSSFLPEIQLQSTSFRVSLQCLDEVGRERGNDNRRSGMFQLGSDAEGEGDCDEGGETEDEDRYYGCGRGGSSHLSEGCSSVMTGTSLQRRWSAIVAGMPDDLEFLRTLDRHFECFGRETAWSWEGGYRTCGNGHVVSSSGHGTDGWVVVGGEGEADEDDKRMQVGARKVMFCIRELIRTERSYLEHLTRASQVQNIHPSSSFFLLLFHLPRLIAASQAFLSGMEQDASAWGVADAFVSASHKIEQALLPWCGIVGSVLSPSKPPLSPITTPTSSSLSSLYCSSLSSAQRAVSLSNVLVSNHTDEVSHTPPSPSPSAMFPAASTTTMPKCQNSLATCTTMSQDGHTATSPLQSQSRLKSSPSISSSRMDSVWRKASLMVRTMSEAGQQMSMMASSEKREASTRSACTEKSLSLQDIAIMPTQRIVRYGMLFRDILKLTPNDSPPYPTVDTALQLATQIAKNCNEAQQNMDLSAT